MVGCCVGGYSQHRQETEQLESFYTVDKKIHSNYIDDDNGILRETVSSHDSSSDNEDAPPMSYKVKSEFEGRKDYYYTYFDHKLASFLSCFACCCQSSRCVRKRVERLNMHHECVESLTGETDIVTIIRNLRQSEFVNKHQLSNYQRFFVNKFKKYHLSAEEDVKEWNVERQENEGELCKPGYDDYIYSPEVIQYNSELLDIDNPTDRRIYFELTGKKIKHNDLILADEEELIYMKDKDDGPRLSLPQQERPIRKR